MDRDHFAIIAESMAGQRPVDEHTHISLEVLADRLRQIRSLGGRFAGIEFSPDARRLRQQCKMVPVG